MAKKTASDPSFYRYAPCASGVESARWLVQEMRRLRPDLMRGAFYVPHSRPSGSTLGFDGRTQPRVQARPGRRT